MVDVPGHERFVRNMVAGATGVNLGLLVVAADDGVMPQTREHLEIMDLLGLRAGVVAITKTDLVDAELIELVHAEVEELVAGTFLEAVPIIAVSSETGDGIDELKAALAALVLHLDEAACRESFRMPIDRVFSVSGHGSVVTGSVLSGEVAVGDTLELHPQGREVRVRGVQSHGVRADEGGARRRTAVNLAGVKAEQLRRGQELATVGFLQSTRRVIVDVRCLSSSPLVLRDRLSLNLHLGTTETPARIIFRGRQIKPGQRGFAELRTKEPIVACWGQRFILRRTSPAVTVAGGRVLDPGIPPLKRIRDMTGYAAAMAAESDIDRLSFFLSQQDSLHDDPLPTAWRAGIDPGRYRAFLDELVSSGSVVTVGSSERGQLVHRNRLDALARSVLRTIREELERHQPRRSLPRNQLAAACRDITNPALVDSVFERLVANRQLVQVGSNYGPADIQVKLTKKQQAARSQLLDAFTAAKLTPPTRKELAAAVGLGVEDVAALLNLCVEDGLLIEVSAELNFTREAIESARRKCATLLEEIGRATMAQLRDAWGVTRKFAVPLCEYFDSQQVTIRNGDLRQAGPAISRSLSGS